MAHAGPKHPVDSPSVTHVPTPRRRAGAVLALAMSLIPACNHGSRPGPPAPHRGSPPADTDSLGQAVVGASSAGSRVIGYFTNWAHQRATPCAFQTRHVDPTLFTHLNYAFAFVDPGKNDRTSTSDPSYTLVSSSPDDPRLYREVNSLKRAHPHLKTLLAVGGWTHNDPPLEWIFSAMASSPRTREPFVLQAIAFLREHGFDGLDLDWEYPGAPERGGQPADKQNFTSLLADFRSAMRSEADATGREELLLTIAAPAGSSTLVHYELSEIHPYVDWINVMTYDYHGEWSGKTGANAPLRGEGESIERTIDLYLEAGVPAHKLVLGMATYARGWSDVEGTLPGSPASGKAPLGACGAESLRSHEVADWVRSGRMQGAWDPRSETPYAFSASAGTWITYEDERSYTAKIAFLRQRELGGAMFWAIDLDDYEGGYPLIGQVARTLLGERTNDRTSLQGEPVDATAPLEQAAVQAP